MQREIGRVEVEKAIARLKYGNKRIAAAIFIYFLDVNSSLYNKDKNKVISDATLVATTLMIATSRPDEKDVVVDLVMNIIGMGLGDTNEK